MDAPRFFTYAEDYIVRHEPDRTVEEIMAEFAWIVEIHKNFETYMRNPHNKTKTRKSPEALERRRMFMAWYIETNKGRLTSELIDELCTLTFSSRTTVTNTIYNYT